MRKTMEKRFEIRRLGEVRMPDGRIRRIYGGVYEAARGIGACHQTVYDYLNGRTGALGKAKRDRLVII